MSDDYDTDRRIEARTYCVRDIDNREPDLGVRHATAAPDATDLEKRGVGYEYSRAADVIEERLDLEEYVGDEIATVVIDYDSAEPYSIDWHVEKSLSDRVREVLRL